VHQATALRSATRLMPAVVPLVVIQSSDTV